MVFYQSSNLHYPSLKSNLSTVVRTQNARCATIPRIKHPTETHRNEVFVVYEMRYAKSNVATTSTTAILKILYE